MRLGARAVRAAWLVAYDISDDQVRRRVAVVLLRHGWRVQKSVFLVELAPEGVRGLVTAVAKLVEPQTDRVDFVPLTATARAGWRAIGGPPPGVDQWVCA